MGGRETERTKTMKAPELKILHGDCRETLRQVPDGSVHCCVTSPPYWGLRSYLPKGHPDKAREIGAEPTPEAYVQTMVEVMREVRRCLHPTGVCLLNIGDSYNAYNGNRGASKSISANIEDAIPDLPSGSGLLCQTLKPKDLCLVPWRVAIALQADGWWVRSVIAWCKKAPMPESVTDRPTSAWEPVFLLARSERYFWDAESVKEKADMKPQQRHTNGRGDKDDGYPPHRRAPGMTNPNGRNLRNVWHLGPEPFSGSHFAVFPTEIPRRAILAGTSARGCCPQCLAPWKRVVEKTGGRDWKNDRMKSKGIPGELNGDGPYKRGQSMEPLNNNKICSTTGWRPTCGCGREDTVPCRVLDPFGGSGTTGAVALELGRSAILCELNEGYLELVRRRADTTPGLPGL